MSREEKLNNLLKEAKEMCANASWPVSEDELVKYHSSSFEFGFACGALWADSHPRKGLVDIEKVCEWIEDNITAYCKGEYIESSSSNTFNIDILEQEAFVKELRKVMEEKTKEIESIEKPKREIPDDWYVAIKDYFSPDTPEEMFASDKKLVEAISNEPVEEGNAQDIPELTEFENRLGEILIPSWDIVRGYKDCEGSTIKDVKNYARELFSMARKQIITEEVVEKAIDYFAHYIPAIGGGYDRAYVLKDFRKELEKGGK